MNRTRAHWTVKSVAGPCLLALVTLADTVSAEGVFSPDSPWMFGDWGGTRTRLQNRGVDFVSGYVGESATNLDGGFDDDTVTRYASQLAVGVDLDLEKLLGIPAAQMRFVATERFGDSLSEDRISDPRAPELAAAQEIYGRGEILRLTDFWYQQQFLDGQLEIKAGRFGVGEDFNVFACDLQNLAFCGSQVGNWTDIWYNWPVSQLAFRARWVFSPQWYVQVGVIDENPNELKTSNKFRLGNSGSNGVLLPVEEAWTPRLWSARLPGRYSAGYYYATGNADDVLEDVNGDLRRFQQLANQVGQVQAYDDPAFQPEQDEEYNAELHWGFHVSNWLTVRPNLQYVWDPGGVEQVDDAFVFGIKMDAEL